MDANELEQSLADPALYMPDFRFTLEQRTQLVAALLSRAGRAEAGEPEKPKVVHFRAAGDERAVFADQCGDCHKVLSRSSGGLGEGSAGPNLSGLFTRFHPRTFPEDRAWSPDRLRKWLDNPRQVRAGALMPPVPLSREQERDLLQTWLPERPGRH
jgi:cytochrome c2